MSTNAGSAVRWYLEFAKVINCTKCTHATDKNLLRDAVENVPQPGYIGARYTRTRLLLVGQNPAVPPSHLVAMDKNYTAKLRAVRAAPTEHHYLALQSVLDDFIPNWPVHGEYFPLAECGLELADIAYCNLVRCRTVTVRGKSPPAPHDDRAKMCREQHFRRWLDLLKPNAVVFIGKWASDPERGGGKECDARRIPWKFVNRSKSLTGPERAANRDEVVKFVRRHVRLA